MIMDKCGDSVQAWRMFGKKIVQMCGTEVPSLLKQVCQ